MAGRNPIGGLGRVLFGDLGQDIVDTLGRKIGALPDANAVLTKPKPTATELRRQANIDRFGYDPNDVPDAPVRTPTDDAGFESYLEQVNPNFKRIAAEDRPNLMMGDMYGMLPRNSEVIRSENGVTFHRAPNGDHYATAFNPDVNEEDVVGYITNRGDGTELAVTQEMQGQGIGGELQYMFRKENPNAATGGLTEAGEKSLQRTYNRLSEEGIAKDAQAAVPAMPSIKKETRGSPENSYDVLTYLDETSGEPLGEMYLRKLRDGSNEVASVTVNPETRRQGVATALYNAAGISAPSDNISLDAFNFWKNRDPNSLPDSLYNYYDDLIGLEIPDMGLITDVRDNFASVKKGGVSGPLYKNQLQDMGLIPKEPK